MKILYKTINKNQVLVIIATKVYYDLNQYDSLI